MATATRKAKAAPTRQTRVNLFDATTPKDLNVSKADWNKIVRLAKGNNKTAGLGARTIAEELGVPRRRVMRVLEIEGVSQFAEGSYN